MDPDREAQGKLSQEDSQLTVYRNEHYFQLAVNNYPWQSTPIRSKTDLS